METRRGLYREQSFLTKDGNPFYEGREIGIKISNSRIKFSFTERRNGEFYSIPLKDFQKDQDYWLTHMRKKSWFTDDMENFITENTNPIL